MPPPQSQITSPSGGRKADAKPTQLPVALPPQPERMVTPTFFNAAGNGAMNTLVSADSELMTAVAARGGSFASANPGFGAPARDRSQAAAGLHDGVTKQPVTPERLLTWAVKQGRSPAELYASIQSSYDFIGSEDDRRAAVQTLALYMDDVQQAIAHNRAEAEKVAEADYQKKGAAREPLGDRQLLISLKELQQVEAGPNFSEPLRAYNMISGSHVTYVKGQEINGYTVVSPQRGIVQKDGYYFQLGESGLNELYSGYHPAQSNVFQREAFKGTEGIGLAYGYALEAAGFAMQFGPVLSRAMAPFISKSGEGIVHDMHAGEAKLKGEDFDEPAPEVGWDTLFEGLASAAAPEIGNKASGAVEKVVAPVLGKAAPLAGKVAGSLTGQYASQVIQKTPDLVSGKASISEVATPHVSASGVAQDLAFGAAHHVAGKVADKIAPGRTLKSEAPHQAPAAKHGGEAKASPPHAEAPAAKAVEPPASAPRTAPTPTGKKPQSPTLSRPATKAKPQRAKAASAPIKKAASEQIKKATPDHPGSGQVPPKPAPDKPAPQKGQKTKPARGRKAPPGAHAIDEPAKAWGTLAEATVPFDPRYSGPDWNHLTGGEETSSSRTSAARWTKHGKTAGIDFIVENRRTGRLVIGEQKAVDSEYFNDATATTVNLEKNLGTAVQSLKASIKAGKVHPDEIAHLEQTIGRLEATRQAVKSGQPLPDGVVFELTNVGGKGSKIGKDYIRNLDQKYGKKPGYVDQLLDRTYIRDPELAASKGRPKSGARGTDADPDLVPARNVLTDDAKDELTRINSGKSPEEWQEEKTQARTAQKQADERAKQEKTAQKKAEREARAAEKQKEKEARAAQRTAVREEREKKKQQAAAERKAARAKGKSKGGPATHEATGAPKQGSTAATGEPKTEEAAVATPPVAKSKAKGGKKTASPAPDDASASGKTPETQRTRAKKSGGPGEATPAVHPKRAAKKAAASTASPRAEEREGASSPAKPRAAAPSAKPGMHEPEQEGGAPRQRAARQKKAGQPESQTATARAAPGPKEEATPPPSAAPAHPVGEAQPSAKAAKSKAKAAVPEHAPPIVREPGGAPTKGDAPKSSHPPSSRGERVTGALGKADAVLGAVRDYEQYTADKASKGSALARAGITLAANLKGGPAAAIVNAANAYDNAHNKMGQGKVEAMATAIGTGAGGIAAAKIAPAGPVGTAVNLANTATQALGAPQGVQDATTGAAALVPSNIVATTVTEGARSYANIATALVTGDTKALDKQVQGFQAGTAGPGIQGWTHVVGMVTGLAAGESFDKALNKAADSDRGSWADRVGSKGGDALYELGQSREAKAGKYGTSVKGISMSLGMASDMIAGDSFEKSLNKAADAGKGSWAEKAGNALGNVAWDATEKMKELSGTDLPAAKQAIKDKWNKLWS